MRRLSRQETRNLTCARLRASARTEFARRGVAASSIDRIAEAAGLSRGAFYANYRSKRDLLLELLAEAQAEEIRIWDSLIDQAADADAMFAPLQARFNLFAERGDWGLLSIELQLEAERDAEFGKLYQQHSQELFARVRDLVRHLFAKAGRESVPDIDLIVVALRSVSLGLTLQNGHVAGLNGSVPGEAITFFLRSVLHAPSAQHAGVR